jgi:hypothetical protein
MLLFLSPLYKIIRVDGPILWRVFTSLIKNIHMIKKIKKCIKKRLRKPAFDMEHEIEEINSNRAVFRKYPELGDDKWPRDWN